MEKITTTLKTIKEIANIMPDNFKINEVYAVMNLNDGTKMTTTLNIIECINPEDKIVCGYMLNISNAVTYKFDTKEELDKYMNKKFETFKSDKEMYMTFTGMDEETWEEWNK